MTSLVKTHSRSLIVFCALIIFTQAIGSYTTFSSVRTWYATLDKAPWTPPNWVFGPVWTVLYISLAIIGWRLWISFSGTVTEKLRQPAIRYYFLQLFFNFLWSPLFFGMRFPALAFADIVLLIIFAFLTLYHIAKINKILAWAFIPYYLWISYAASLNGAIVIMN